ncbi:MAG: DUF4294 domain-containing protein [Bacteroidota bacterium]
MKRGILILSLLLVYGFLYGQKDSVSLSGDSIPQRFYLLQKIKRDGETLPEIEIKEVAVVGRMQGSPRRERSQFRQYQRLVYNLKKVYPYAMIVRERLAEVNGGLLAMSDEKERKNYLKQFEKEVFREYEDDIRDMTITQGKLLLKLIYRETYYTSYDLIKEYRGGINAAFWQGIARIFGTNLKSEYDPYGEDILVELILQDIQAGLL